MKGNDHAWLHAALITALRVKFWRSTRWRSADDQPEVSLVSAGKVVPRGLLGL